MKLAGYGKEIYISLSQQFGEGIVVSVIRQLNQILLRSTNFAFHYHTILKELSYGE